MATYFITGGLGFLGQYIVQAVHDYDPRAEIRVLVRTKRSTFLPIQELEGIRWVHGDLLLPETYTSALEGVDAIIHNAAMVSFRRSEADQIHRANVLGTRMLAGLVQKRGSVRDALYAKDSTPAASRQARMASAGRTSVTRRRGCPGHSPPFPPNSGRPWSCSNWTACRSRRSRRFRASRFPR